MTNAQRNIDRIEDAGTMVLRYGLVLIFLCFGALKFTTHEAEGIAPFGMNSPLLSWAFAALGQQGFSYALGTIEILVGLLIATRPFSAKLSAVGSIGAIVTFLITLSLLFSTPGVIEEGYSFPALSGKIGTFLLKDVVLLAASIWTAAEALRAARAGSGQGPLPAAAIDLARIGAFALRYGLALVFLWFGALKFTEYSAKGAANFAMNSPILSWAYNLLGMQGFARTIGITEMTIGLLIAIRLFAPKLSFAGSIGATITFAITLTFLLTTPDVAMVGAFLLKDVVLIGAAIWTAGEAMRAVGDWNRTRVPALTAEPRADSR